MKPIENTSPHNSLMQGIPKPYHHGSFCQRFRQCGRNGFLQLPKLAKYMAETKLYTWAKFIVTDDDEAVGRDSAKEGKHARNIKV